MAESSRHEDISTSINPIHILHQLNSEFQRSKRDQIDRFLRDQDDLNCRFNEFALHSENEAADGSASDGDSDDVESEFNLRLDTFRVRPLSARIGSWALDDFEVGEDAENNNMMHDNAKRNEDIGHGDETNKRLSVMSQCSNHLSSSSDEEGARQAQQNRARNIQPAQNQKTRGAVQESLYAGQKDHYAKFARNRDRSTSRDRKTGVRNRTPETSVRKKLPQSGGGGGNRLPRDKSRDRPISRAVNRDVAASKTSKSKEASNPTPAPADNIDPEEKQLVDKVQPKKLLVRRRYRPRTAMGLQQTSRGGGNAGGTQEETVDLQPQEKTAQEEETEVKTPAIRPMRASAPAGVSRVQKVSWESEEMKRTTYMERQTTRGNSPSLMPGMTTVGASGIASSMAGLHQRTSTRQQELLASASVSNLTSNNAEASLRQSNNFGKTDSPTSSKKHSPSLGKKDSPSSNLRQNLIQGRDINTLRQSYAFANNDSSSNLGSLRQQTLGLGGGSGTPRLRDPPSRQTPRSAAPVSTPRLAPSSRTTSSRTTDPLLSQTPRGGAGSDVRTTTLKMDTKIDSSSSSSSKTSYNNPPNSPSRNRKQYLSPTRKPMSHQRKVGLGAPTEAGGALRSSGHISLFKLPQLGGQGLGGSEGGTSVHSKKAVPHPKEHALLANSST